MNIILNSYCNLKCNYCFADEYMEETVNTPGKSMDYDYFTQEMLPKIKTSGGINFMGGEPTLHPQFNEIFSNTLNAMSPYSNLGLFTNGLMKDHVLDLLEQTISIQGSIQRHITCAWRRTALWALWWVIADDTSTSIQGPPRSTRDHDCPWRTYLRKKPRTMPRSGETAPS